MSAFLSHDWFSIPMKTPCLLEASQYLVQSYPTEQTVLEIFLPLQRYYLCFSSLLPATGGLPCPLAFSWGSAEEEFQWKIGRKKKGDSIYFPGSFLTGSSWPHCIPQWKVDISLSLASSTPLSPSGSNIHFSPSSCNISTTAKTSLLTSLYGSIHPVHIFLNVSL